MINFYINTNDLNAIDWKTVLTVLGTLGSVWFGAYLKDKKESKVSKKERFQRILELQLDINLIENYILAYETAMDKEIFIDDICSLQKLDISFNPNLKDYTFLTNYNVYFINLLDIISRQTKSIQESIDCYISSLYTYINMANSIANPILLEQLRARLKNTFSEIKGAIKGLKILIVTYNLVIKTSVQGNLDYAYNLRLGENIVSLSYECIDNYQDHPAYTNWNKIVESGRRNPKNIRCLICSFIEKIKPTWTNFTGFFAHKPINCRKDKEKEICNK